MERLLSTREDYKRFSSFGVNDNSWCYYFRIAYRAYALRFQTNHAGCDIFVMKMNEFLGMRCEFSIFLCTMTLGLVHLKIRLSVQYAWDCLRHCLEAPCAYFERTARQNESFWSLWNDVRLKSSIVLLFPWLFSGGDFHLKKMVITLCVKFRWTSVISMNRYEARTYYSRLTVC